ncbi:NAD(P)H-binding protein [Mycolicibacterium sp. BiH015]|uniref:NAD(P)H-binding protein n=1 Tax=Mycolicibacterium sp. BiH015 TaxID=3018808 RepID=UPI0022E87F7D|nr:NAD(P)H-binding protein [Mycolicibacterium sp. BiH015]MDA2892097.1 NAD(P)H-binding protein [Mycolicibacterium sp. BiH015]
MSAPVLVTGATGNTGSAVSRLLKAAAVEVREASRRPGPEGVRFDWNDPSSYAPALRNVERVYLVAPIGEAEPAPIVQSFLEVGLRQGVRRVVLLSSSAVEPADTGLGALHRLVTDSVPEWAILQPSWFMQNLVGDHPVAHGLRNGLLTTATGDGRIGFVDAEDIAAVAAHCLLRDDAPNASLVITGPEALSYADVCRLVGELTGRPIRHVAVGTAERAAQIAATGVPHEYAAVLAAMDDQISRGSEDRVTDTVARFTGRPAVSLAEFLARHRPNLRNMSET